MRGALAIGVCGMLLVGGAARADHTGEDARRTTRRLEAIMHEAEAPKHKEEAPARKAKAVAKPAAKIDAKTQAQAAGAAPKNVSATSKSASATPVKADVPKADAPAKRATVVKARHDEGDAIADEMGKVVEHSMRIAFDPKEQAAHLKDIPKTPAEVEAHLRRLNRALDDAHRR